MGSKLRWSYYCRDALYRGLLLAKQSKERDSRRCRLKYKCLTSTTHLSLPGRHLQSSKLYCLYPHCEMRHTGDIELKPSEELRVGRNGFRYIYDRGRLVDFLPPARARYEERPKWDPKKGKKPQMVWPRDKKQKGAHTWGRLTDIFTGKGPDIWIGRQYSSGPHRPVWSGWKTPGYYPEGKLVWDNLGYPYRKYDTVLPPSWARRGKDEKYDFRSRTYRRPRAGVWSDVKWSNFEPHMALYHRDRDGFAVVEPEFDSGWFNLGLSRNPFANNRYTPEWNWNVGDARRW